MTQTARTYGAALYELARDEGLSDDVFAQLQMTAGLLRENPDYMRLLSLPSVPKGERCAVLDESFGGRVHEYLLSFLKVLVERGAIGELYGCEETFRRRYYEDHGILEVTASAAAPLPDGQKEKLERRLAEKTGKDIRLTVRVDPEVLGGLRLELAGKRLDGTVRRRLEEIASRLRETTL